MRNVRIKWLDELRGLAALMVVLFHYFTNYDKHYSHSFSVPDFLEFGALGVNLFFIISGFVIFMTINRMKDIKAFAISRFSRLYPAFWVALFLSFIFTQFLGPSDRAVGFKTFFLNFSMIQEYLGFAHVDNVYWTLSIELAFYFWMGVLLFTRQVRNIHYFLIVAVIASFWVNDLPNIIRQLFIIKYISLFAAGISFYQLSSKSGSKTTYLVLVLSLVSIFLNYHLINAFIISIFYAVFWLMSGKDDYSPNRVLVYLGSISYSLYLVHQNIGYGIIQQSYSYGVPPYISIALALAFSLLLAHLITSFVEKPSLKFLRGFFKENTR